jgi:hypothetical protein
LGTIGKIKEKCKKEGVRKGMASQVIIGTLPLGARALNTHV